MTAARSEVTWRRSCSGSSAQWTRTPPDVGAPSRELLAGTCVCTAETLNTKTPRICRSERQVSLPPTRTAAAIVPSRSRRPYLFRRSLMSLPARTEEVIWRAVSPWCRRSSRVYTCGANTVVASCCGVGVGTQRACRRPAGENGAWFRCGILQSISGVCRASARPRGRHQPLPQTFTTQEERRAWSRAPRRGLYLARKVLNCEPKFLRSCGREGGQPAPGGVCLDSASSSTTRPRCSMVPLR